jgi:acyl-coenzyme A thioesterase PaaI-like protein
MDNYSQEFIRSMTRGMKFRLFLLTKLPAAFFTGLRIREMDERRCAVTVPFKWFTKNPFSSTYFACLAMAAEMSTGALAMAYLYKSHPRVSMLVTGIRANYFKKATGLTCFTCEQGIQFRDIIRKAIETGAPQQFTAISTGKDSQGELIAEFFIEWGFKAKK